MNRKNYMLLPELRTGTLIGATLFTFLAYISISSSEEYRKITAHLELRNMMYKGFEDGQKQAYEIGRLDKRLGSLVMCIDHTGTLKSYPLIQDDCKGYLLKDPGLGYRG